MSDSAPPPAFAGRTFLFRVDNGAEFRNTYSADGGRLRWEGLGESAGQWDDVALHVAEVGPQLYFVNWTERSGLTVSHVMDLSALTVRVFWTYEGAGGRVGELHTGTLEPVG
ncbi:MoaF N-terminal domain-containing protein [Streptacidiphilus sp. ASG 303]|uniref:MoaF-related domain-containing protein n=1 Tax=Streptomycetaceae TaxID=2062 RepID=UPI001E338738|nr:MoaF N-terminal domain-containing protein [Streptacidiphilus sp. ASG 303]MCD0481464.1 MoaF N-terminal domain-containing protein [Streptacidiphilus sp. ASG 303]